MKRILLFGTLSLFFANLIYMVFSYGVNIFLAKTLGAANYGIYAVVVSLLSLVIIIFSSGVNGAVSKFISKNPEESEEIKSAGIKLSAFSGTILFIAYFLSADLIAQILNDPSLGNLIRMSSIMIPIYFFYPVFLGYFNGLKDYSKQAAITISYSITKFFIIVLLVLLGFSVLGAVIGFAIAPLSALILGLYYSKTKKATKSFNLIKILKLAIPITIFSFLFESSFTLGLFSVKSILVQDYFVGQYNAALQIARFPYYLTMALSGALFPVVSESFSNKKIVELKKNLSKTFKYFIIFILTTTIAIFVFSFQILTILFGREFAPASPSLQVLSLASIFVAMFYILCIILIGIEKEKYSVVIAFSVLILAWFSNLLLIPLFSLLGAAIATFVAFFSGSVIAGIIVLKFMIKSEKNNG
ncbi:MAG: oligosaccharide flippase family protein [archaeon]